MIHLSRQFKSEIKAKILVFLCTITIFSTVLAMDKIANGEESIIGKLELHSAEGEAIDMASYDDDFLEANDVLTTEESDMQVSETTDRLENTDTITYIYDADDLLAFRDSVNSGNDYAGKTVYVMADIDMSMVCSETLGSFTPIGARSGEESIYFAGTFNGKYHTIRNLYIKDNKYESLGLFNRTADTSVIRNVILENVYIYNEYSIVGGSTFAAGIVGVHRGEIINCGINSGTITGIKTTSYTGSAYVGVEVGGMVGCTYGKISNCYNKADIIAKAGTKNYPNEGFAGGIAGIVSDRGNVQNCYNTGNLNAGGYQGFAGGIVGSANRIGTGQFVKNSYSTGIAKATGSYDAFQGGIIGRTGWSSTYPSITIDNVYHTTNNTYSYYYWNGTKVGPSTVGKTESNVLKTYATKLGSAFSEDSITINEGYPVLRWELPRYKIIENQEYIKIGQNLPFTIERIMFREGMEDNLEDIQWSSSNEEIATVDMNGVVTGTGMGHATITAYHPKNGLKTRAIVHVYRNQEGAITIPQIIEQESSTIVLKENGTVWATGLNDKGQLGDGTTTNRNNLVQVKITEDTYLTDVVKLTAGDQEGVVALTKQGEVYGWGSNAFGNLATGGKEKQVYAHKMEINGGYKIIDVAATNMMTHVLAEHDDVYYVGTCVSDGYNFNNNHTTTYTFKGMFELEDTIKLESHGSPYGSYLAMKSDGLTFGWAYDQWGQLAQGSTQTMRNLTLVGTDIIDIEIGDYATIVQKEDGEFYIAGENRYGGTGVGASDILTTFQKLSLPNDENGTARKIIKVQRQGYNTVVLASDGTVWASGLNAVGQLSQGNTTNTNTLVQLKNNETEYLENAIDISSGEVSGDNKTRNANIGVIKEDGTIWLAGDNTYGQIGSENKESSGYLMKLGGEDSLSYEEKEIELSIDETYLIDSEKLHYKINLFNVFGERTYEKGNVTYSSLNEEIATVDENGIITAKKQMETTKIKIEDTTNGLETYLTVKINDRLQNTDTITYIYDANDLVAFRDSVNNGNDYAGKTVYVMDDIDMSTVCSETLGSFTPIGATGTNFAGIFDGNYHIIRNLYIHSNAYQNIGLFVIIANTAIVKDLEMSQVNIHNIKDVARTYTYTGSVVGNNKGTIMNCGINDGKVKGTKSTNGYGPIVGGIAGVNNGSISGCYNKASIEGSSPLSSSNDNEMLTGGIVGCNYNKIENCYNTGNITGSSYQVSIGGIMGHAQINNGLTPYLKNCYNYGTITSGSGTYKYVGGIAGRNGWSNNYQAIPLSNNYTRNDSAYSSYYWNGSAIIPSTAGKVEADVLKTYSTKLGNAFVDDTIHKNNGYPLLIWELPQYKIKENQSYIKVGESIELTLEKSRFREEYEELPEDITWVSSNEEVATVDANGVVTGQGIGHTTITVYHTKIGIKAKAIINVYRNQEGAITVPQVEIGEGYSVILKEDGTVWATGLNDKGQLGDGTTTNRNIPTQVKIDETTYLTNIRKISTGIYHTVALTMQGEVYVWGYNLFGQLGQGDKTTRMYATKMKGLGGTGSLNGIIDVVSGAYSIYAMNPEGDIFASGGNEFGEINGSNASHVYPVRIPDMRHAIKLVAGTCTITAINSNGEVWTKGWNGEGGFGNNTTALNGGLYLMGTDINEVGYSAWSSYILKEDKTVWASGYNDYGQLGLGDTTRRTVHTQMRFEDGTPVKAKTISSGTRNLQFQGEDGKVYVTGYNENGQLSIGTTTNATYPTIMKNEDGTELTNSLLLAWGGNSYWERKPKNMGIIKDDGTIWLSGDNTYGQMGNGTNEGANYLTQMGKESINYAEESIVLGVNELKAIQKVLFEYQPKINVFVDKSKWVGDLQYEVEDEEIATVTSLGMIQGKKKGLTRVKVTDKITGASTFISVNVLDDTIVSYDGIALIKQEDGKYKVTIADTVTEGMIQVVAKDVTAQVDIGNTAQYEEGSKQYTVTIDPKTAEKIIEIPISIVAKDGTTETTSIIITRISSNAETEKVEGTYTTGGIKTTKEAVLEEETIYVLGVKEDVDEVDIKITAQDKDATIIRENDTSVEDTENTINVGISGADTSKENGSQASRGNTAVSLTDGMTDEEENQETTGSKEVETVEKGVGTLTTKVILTGRETTMDYRILAEDKKVSKTKTVKIIKLSSEATLAKLEVYGKVVVADSNGMYQVSVEGGTTQVPVTATATSSGATIAISKNASPGSGKAVLNTMLSTPQIENSYIINLTAEDGTTKQYVLKITKQTNIAGKIITENAEGKHKAMVTVYKTKDTNPEDTDNNTISNHNNDNNTLYNSTLKDGTLNSEETNEEIANNEKSDHTETSNSVNSKTNTREIIARQETKEDGTFVVEVKDIEPYDIVITKLGYLDYRITDIEVEQGEKTQLEPYNLIAGDVVKTGQIEIDDLVAINDNIGVVITEENRAEKEIYDLNEDGKVDKLDRDILKKNYGKKNNIEHWEDPRRIRRMRTRRVETLPENPQNFILPIKGKYQITSEYGSRIHPVTGEEKKHTGIDLGGEHRTEIYAVAEGEVVFAGVQKAFGNCIEIKHIVNGETIYSFYAHLSRIDVVEGQEVKQGEIIGLEGGDPETDPNPGSSTGHHLHFELRRKSGYGNDVDPRDYIEF